MVETACRIESKVGCFRNAVLLLLAVILVPRFCLPESLASKNKKGNRLFEQGRYEDAEKAYLSAQVDDPGKPEILYNLGNSLIRQKKYQQGVQTLQQSIHGGDKEIKERSWYNKGNALFSEGNYRESADAFIQALKLNPSDRDAKHNLELALLELKQQEQQKKEDNQKQKEQKGSGQDKRQRQPRQPDQDKGGQGSRKEQQDQAKDQANEPAQREGSMTREQALQLLNAVQNQELEQQRKLLERRSKEKPNARDW